MAEQDWNTIKKNKSEPPRAAKKQSQDAAFRHERVFETRALSFGKVQPTNFQCRFHRMNS
jgi:hypothetical protein